MSSHSNRVFLALLFVLAFAVQSLPVFGASVISGPAYSLSLAAVPTKLPADGKTYHAVVISLVDKTGLPSLTLNDTKVFLTSSEENIGTIDAIVTIAPGRAYAIANFTTSPTPGVTIITASSVGLGSTTTPVVTVIPSGYPTHLRVFPVPAAQVARRHSTGTFVIELVDDVGLPAKAVADTAVSLSSSNIAILNVSASFATVNTGSFLTFVDYTAGFVTGFASVTVSATGFASDSATVSVVGTAPLKLKVYAQPSSIPVSYSGGRLVIALTDLSGKPARAPYDIPVSITSSNTNVAVVVQTAVTIAAGSIYFIGNFNSLGLRGSSTITVSSQGLVSGFATINVGAISSPTALSLYVAPNPVLADNSSYNAVVVSLVNGTGFPSLATSAISVTLTSSDRTVGRIDARITIGSGSNFNSAQFSSSFFVGTTTITASAQNLVTSQASMQTFGPIPAKVVVSSTPQNLPADGGSYRALSVSLQDALGAPAIAPTGISVFLTSARPNIMSVDPFVTIPQGSTSTTSLITTTVSEGNSNITAFSSGYASSSIVVSSTHPAPFQLGVYVSPSSAIVTKDGNDALLVVQLQDAGGNPARARQDTAVIVISSNMSVLNEPVNLLIPLGTDYARTYLSMHGPGGSVLTATTPGLASASTQLNAAKFPLSSKLFASSLTIHSNETASLTLTVEAFGLGLEGANVTWIASAGTISPQSAVTDSAGRSGARFTPSLAGVGVSNIIARVSHLGIANLNLTSSIIVLPQRQAPKPSLLAQLTSFPYMLAPIGGIAAAGIGSFVVLRKRRKARGAEDADSSFIQ